MGRKGCKMDRKPKDQQQGQGLGRNGCEMGRKPIDQQQGQELARKDCKTGRKSQRLAEELGRQERLHDGQ